MESGEDNDVASTIASGDQLDLPSNPSFGAKSSPASASSGARVVSILSSVSWYRASFAILLVTLGLAVAYVGTGYWTLLNLKHAVVENDLALLDSVVNFNAVQTSLAKNLESTVRVQVADSETISSFEGYRDGGFVHKAVRESLRPVNRIDLLSAIQGGGWVASWSGFPNFRSPGRMALILKEIRINGMMSDWHDVGGKRFRRKISVSASAPVLILTLRLSRWKWQLVEVRAAGPVTCQLEEVKQGPKVSVDLFEIQVATGEEAKLSVEVEGTPPFEYQWHKDGAPIAGKTTREISFTEARSNQSGVYSVDVSNSVGQVTSDPIHVVVNPIPEWQGRWELEGGLSLVLTQKGSDVSGTLLPVDVRFVAKSRGRQLFGNYKAKQRGARFSHNYTVNLTMSLDGDSFEGAVRNNTVRRNFNWAGNRVKSH